MKNTCKIVLIICFLFLNFVTFAQDANPGAGDGSGGGNLEGGDAYTISEASPGAGDGSGGGNLEGGDAPATPINGSVWILIFIGVIYSYSLVMRNYQIRKLTQ